MRFQAEANFEALIESTNELIWSVDQEFRLLAFNSAFKRYIFLTYHLEPEPGMALLDLITPEQAAPWRQDYERALQEGPFQTEQTLITGATVELSFHPIQVEGTACGVSVFSRDVTCRKVDEEMHRHLAAVVESSADAYLSLTRNGVIFSWNQAAENIFGYKSEEAINKPVRMVVSEEDWGLLAKQIESVTSSEPIQHQLYTVVRNDGQRKQLIVNAWPVRNPAGEVTAISVVARDMYDRLEAEQAKALLASIVENSVDAVFTTDAQGYITRWNRGTERLLGYTPAEIIGRRVLELISDHQRPMVSKKLESRQKGEVYPDYDTVMCHKSGEEIDVSVSVSSICDSAGAVTGFLSFVRDARERKRLERTLIEAERKYRALFDSALEGIYQISMEGKFLTANLSCARLLGYDSVEELKTSIGEVGTELWVEQTDRTRYLEAVHSSTDPVMGFACRFHRRDGSVIWVSLNSRLVRDAQNEPRYHEGFFEDITVHVQSMQALTASENRFRNLFEDSKIAQLLVDPLTEEILNANHAAAEFYGYPIEKLVGNNIALLNHMPQEKIRQERQNAVLQNRTFFNFKHWLASGEVRDVQVYSSPIDYGDKIVLLTNIFDVTEKVRAEQVLRETADSLAQAQKIGGLGSYTVDLLSGQCTTSTVLDEIFGLLPEDPRTLECWFAMMHPEDHEAMQAYFAVEIMEKHTPLNREYRIVRPSDGVERWVHALGHLDYDEADQPVQLRGVIKDITEVKQAELRLRASEQRYRTTFQMNIDTVLVSRIRDGVFLDASRAIKDVMGYTRAEVVGKTSMELGFWAEESDYQNVRRELLEHGVCHNYQAQFVKKDGGLLWGLMSVSIVEIDGEPCALSITRDITQAKLAEQRLAEAQKALRISEERYRTVFQATLDCISIHRLKDNILIDVNSAFLDMFGYESQEVLGNTSLNLDLWAEPSAREKMYQVMREQGSFRDARTRFRKKNGELIWVMISSSLIEIEGTACVLNIIRDVSDAKAAEDKIWNLAFYDPLTRLPNRRLLMDRLRQSLASATRSHDMRALLFIDLDNFKNLNDTLGHQNGDTLLCEVARRLSNCVRESDTVARLGGDEFVVLLNGLGAQYEKAAALAENIVQKILDAIEKSYWLDKREYFSSSSIGITVFSGKNESVDEILQQADIAMYQAKAAGRNTMRFFAPALQAAVQTRAAMEDEIRSALRNNHFLLYYQPQLDRNHLTGVEALLRWQHPYRGLLQPGQFISLAEESGLIVPLGDWVLEAACQQIHLWNNADPPFPIPLSVNISARQFRQPGFVEHVLDVLRRNDANPACLDLELTESMLLDNIDDAIAKMNELKQHGVHFSLDDFGTGYSSLSYLKRLPFDQLKIDRSFVRDLLDDIGSQAIARSIISLGRALGLNVIAEGVESCEQRDLLIDLGCSSFQGYFFSHPLPLADFEDRWRSASGAEQSFARITRFC
ncbi:PAS domain S-box protein [Telmatobacter bradus]|uniref:PAS domain S-box protein n=1 Tax=Telmatobacter bradus TaxID=474953 RepID=UPI003B4384FF